MEDPKLALSTNNEAMDASRSQSELIEELSIFELDERLEFVAWCDNCACTGEPE